MFRVLFSVYKREQIIIYNKIAQARGALFVIRTRVTCKISSFFFHVLYYFSLS